MNIVSDPNDSKDIALLEALIVENQELERLEELLDQFNIFEALGAVNVELRHSDFLAFLLNPNQNHGLGDLFAKRLLQKAIAGAIGNSLIRPIDLDVADLNKIMVLREWQNIDILLVDETNRIAVVIENKILSNEHDNQLNRYREIVNQHYPAYRQVYLFLTPEGETPSVPEYIAMDYSLIASLVEQIHEARKTTLGSDVRTLLQHYSQMLRRHIVSESEIASLCKEIYRKHQRALDMIYEYRPDLQATIQEMIMQHLSSSTDLIVDHSSKSYIHFAPEEWDTPMLKQCSGWTRSGRMLLFEFRNAPDRLSLALIIGPGPLDVRQGLHDLAHQHHPLKPSFSTLGKMYNTIYVRYWLTAKTYENSSVDEIEKEIRTKWAQFMEHDLLEIRNLLKNQEWIWASPEAYNET